MVFFHSIFSSKITNDKDYRNKCAILKKLTINYVVQTKELVRRYTTTTCCRCPYDIFTLWGLKTSVEFRGFVETNFKSLKFSEFSKSKKTENVFLTGLLSSFTKIKNPYFSPYRCWPVELPPTSGKSRPCSTPRTGAGGCWATLSPHPSSKYK